MIPKESEPTRFLEVPWISKKTSSEQLKSWSKQLWPSDGRRRVATDIVNNGKELLAGSNTNWDLVLSSIRTQQLETAFYGEAAIAANGARVIGGLGAVADWSMHDPAMVYLSGKLLADRAKSGGELEDFKRTMREKAVDYGQKLLPRADSYMEILDLFLRGTNRRRGSYITNRLVTLLRTATLKKLIK